MKKIQRALLSVSDKTDLVPLARVLADHGCELISTGGTAVAMREANLDVTDVSSVTGNPEAFGGRMKTLSFEIGSALLFDRERDAAEASSLNIEPIDLVVCNLYPFEQKRDQGVGLDELVENIDIGGPTMIRAAAKNFRHVAVVTSPADYPVLIDELQRQDGALGPDTRARLMRQAYNHTADYDAAIAVELDRRAEQPSLRLAFENGQTLRYGENSHQHALLLRQRRAENSICDMQVLGGKALSYNNLVDLQGAVDAVRDLNNQGCAVIKHTNPCGLASGDKQRAVLEAAWAGDPVSAFGSVIAFTQSLSLDTARFFDLDAPKKSQRKFIEIVAAPDFDEDTLDYLRMHKDLRIVRIAADRAAHSVELRYLAGAMLQQDVDTDLWSKLETVTEDGDTVLDTELMRFGQIAVRQIKSNAICLVRRRDDNMLQLLGMGSGQPNRVNSVKLTVARARDNLRLEYCGEEAGFDAYCTKQMARADLISDAFFPFADSIDQAAEAGMKLVVQPGGSIRDKRVIKRSKELGVTLVMTGMRHFKH